MHDAIYHNEASLLQKIETISCNSTTPVYIAIDGRSGSGKSTFANKLLTSIGSELVTVIEGDTFYRGGTATQWANRSARHNAGNAIDWQKLQQVITALKTTGQASWYAFDWHSDAWDASYPPLESSPRIAIQKQLIIVEGVYSAREELACHYDYRILLDVPAPVCWQRVTAREGCDFDAGWAQRWSDAESHYFSQIATTRHFHLRLLARNVS